MISKVLFLPIFMVNWLFVGDFLHLTVLCTIHAFIV